VKFRAIAFDLAGVLLDSEKAHESAARRAAAQLDLFVPEQAWLRLRGGAYEDFFAHLTSLPENAHRRLRPMQVVLLAYDIYHDEVQRTARLFDDSIALLEAARARFAYVAVATSSEWRLVDTALGHFGLTGYFDAIVSGDHLTQKKPAPEAYLVTAWLLGVRPASMVVVEDSTHGIRAARLARAHAIGLATSRDAEALRAARAHWVVRDHAELIARLDAMAQAGGIEGRGRPVPVSAPARAPGPAEVSRATAQADRSAASAPA
jgi:HAD superfamily hydrolase (TIGR01509 family)